MLLHMPLPLPRHLEAEAKAVAALLVQAQFEEKNIALVCNNFGDDPELLAMARQRFLDAALAAHQATHVLVEKIMLGIMEKAIVLND